MLPLLVASLITCLPNTKASKASFERLVSPTPSSSMSNRSRFAQFVKYQVVLRPYVNSAVTINIVITVFQPSLPLLPAASLSVKSLLFHAAP